VSQKCNNDRLPPAAVTSMPAMQTVDLANRMSRLGTETAFEVLARARALEATGRSIVHLEIGEPGFDTPPNVVDAAVKALREGHTHYVQSAGIPEARAAIADVFTATRGVPARFSLPEEFYVHQPGVERRTRVLARWGAVRRPLVWVRTPGRGRVFYDALGHFTATWSDPRQRALVRSGLRWVLRLD